MYLSLLLYNHSFSKKYIKYYFKSLFDKKPKPILLEYLSKEDTQEYVEWEFLHLTRELRDKTPE